MHGYTFIPDMLHLAENKSENIQIRQQGKEQIHSSTSPMIPLSLLSRVEVGLWEGGPGLLLLMDPGAGPGAGLRTGLERVPLGLVLELQSGEGKGKGWCKGWPPALWLRVDEGLSEQGEAVLQVKVELGLPPWAEESHWKIMFKKVHIRHEERREGRK